MRAILLALLLCMGAGAHAVEADARYTDYLREHARSPSDYIVSKFADADVLLLGEDHAIAQNLAFVANLIPALHAAGVHNLVVEFGAEEDQQALDRLLVAPAYDADALRQLMFNYNSAWSWTEYRDLYRAAWRFNRSLPQGQAPFRIVNMSYVYRWQHYGAPRSPEMLRRVFWRGPIDRFRADLIEREVLARDGKALVLTGTPHALTRYAMPRTDDNGEGFCGYDANWLGNHLLRRHPGRVTNVLLHRPFHGFPGGPAAYVQPAQGAVERILAALDNPPLGFDLRGSVMGTLPDRSFYSTCHDDFRLGDLFDGYIFLAPINALQPATVDQGFVDASNLEAALSNFPDPDWTTPPRNLQEFRTHLRGMAEEIRLRYQSVGAAPHGTPEP